ncbi:IS110 family transposase [Spirochaetota bacterium]
MFYGIDLHTESFKEAILSESSDKIKIKTVSLKTNAFSEFLNNLTKEDYIAVEASTNTFWFVEQVKDRVKRVHVIDPFKFSVIANSRNKTDKIDARKIVKKLKYYELYDKSTDEFPTIYIPEKEISELRSMFVTYNIIKKEVCMTKNRIRSLFRQNGIFNFSGKNLSYKNVQEEILGLRGSVSLLSQIRILISVLQSLEEEKKNIKEEILRKGKIFYKEIQLMTSIRGISPFLAIAIMSDIADINRFPNAKKLCSYLRTAPSINASGNKAHVGKVNKQSRTLTASLMTESIKHFVDSSGRMNRFYLQKRKGKSAGKVRVAVMRKIIVIIYNMLKRKQLYYYTDVKNHAAKLKTYESIIAA